MKFVFWPDDNDRPSDLGGKAAALASLPPFDWLVPPWFVLRPGAFWASLSEADQRLITNGGDDTALEAIWTNLTIGKSVRLELGKALARLCPNAELCAIRSSALEEDGRRHSFAGQYESFLGVGVEDAPAKVAAVWRSAFSHRIRSYREGQQLGLNSQVPAILIQRMARAEAAGAAFSGDPVSGRRAVVVVSAVYGLGTSLVSGKSDADTWKIDRTGKIFARTIGNKRFREAAMADGIQSEPVVDAKRVLPVLTDEQVRRVADLARSAARHFGSPQDIEWALADGKLWLLQARPITTLCGLTDPDDLVRIWDNSNITESYSGVTTPLTFSFARRAYEGVYRQFCHLLAVPLAKIADHQVTFREMLGLIQGRVYYNLLNWYRVLALLPGFTFNRKFMEQMMGVKEPLPTDLLQELDRASIAERARDAAQLGWMCLVILTHHLLLTRRIRGFEQRLREALQHSSVPLELQSADELAACFRELERKLLTGWDAPLLNDFFTMIFAGVLRRLTTNWCGDATGSLLPGLLGGHTGIISGEPAQRITKLAELASHDPQLPDLLRTGSLREIQVALVQMPDFKRGIETYLDDFADRCLNELKLESLTLRDDPLPLLRAIGRLAAPQRNPDTTSTSGEKEDLSVAAERIALQQLGSNPCRRVIFQWVLRHVRTRTRTRENLRFERTRLFGRVRQIFLELGKRLAAEGHLAQPRDVFYLEVDELLGFQSGTATAADLAAVAAVRKRDFAKFKDAPPPPSRLTTTGSPLRNRWQTGPGRPGQQSSDDGWRQGNGCSPGFVRGFARVIRNPADAQLHRGEILVAEHTDPGWILLFAGAQGLLVERGSILSHSAIVARELQIPAIVGIPGLMAWLKDGDWIEMDGRTGSVRRLGAGTVFPPSLAPEADLADPVPAAAACGGSASCYES
jgi:pyruvate,water dikinase